MSKSFQNCQKKFKKLSKNVQKLYKKWPKKEEEDWWLLDQVATPSHLVKICRSTSKRVPASCGMGIPYSKNSLCFLIISKDSISKDTRVEEKGSPSSQGLHSEWFNKR
jgi:hypothetical protein